MIESLKRISYKKLRIQLAGLFVIFICIYNGAVAQGNLLVTPKRVVFDGSARSQELNLANTGSDTATYQISFIQIRMKDDGSFEQITTPDSAQLFADKNLRFFPRSVTLGPNEAQTLKIQVSRTDQLKPGEYRSHLYLRANSNSKPLGTTINKDSGISVSLVPIFGISLPIIIRIGESNTQVSLSDVTLAWDNNAKPFVSMSFNRAGNMSQYGDLSVNHISPEGKSTNLAMIRGIAVYTPNTVRHLRVPLEQKNGVDLHSGKILLTYMDQSARPVKLAEQEITLK